MLKYPYRNPEPGPDATGGGGGTPPPAAPPTTPPAGAPDPKVVEQESSELNDLLGKDALDDTQKARLTALQEKYEISYTGSDGKPLTQDQVRAAKEVETKVKTILAKEEKTRTEEEKKFLTDNTEPDVKTKKFYEEVEELSGLSYAEDIDYGDVDPHTPQGAVIREDYIRKEGAEIYQEQMREQFPLAYNFLQHLQVGGKPEDFLRQDALNYSEITLDKEDKATQERILRIALAAKGNSPDIIDTVVTAMKDGGKLYDKSKQELEALQQSQEARQKRTNQELKEQQVRKSKDIKELHDGVTTAIEKGFDNIKIPKTDEKGFYEYLATRFQYGKDGNFIFRNTFTVKDLNKVLKSAYFDYKGGDLAGLVERKATTQQALKIKNSIKPQIIPKGADGGKKFVPLSEI